MVCCLIYFCFFLFLDVVLENMKIRRERQEAKRRAEEMKQEAGTGSAKTAEDTAGLAPQLDNGQQKDTEAKEDAAKEDAASEGKCEADAFI